MNDVAPPPLVLLSLAQSISNQNRSVVLQRAEEDHVVEEVAHRENQVAAQCRSLTHLEFRVRATKTESPSPQKADLMKELNPLLIEEHTIGYIRYNKGYPLIEISWFLPH